MYNIFSIYVYKNYLIAYIILTHTRDHTSYWHLHYCVLYYHRKKVALNTYGSDLICTSYNSSKRRFTQKNWHVEFKKTTKVEITLHPSQLSTWIALCTQGNHRKLLTWVTANQLRSTQWDRPSSFIRLAKTVQCSSRGAHTNVKSPSFLRAINTNSPKPWLMPQYCGTFTITWRLVSGTISFVSSKNSSSSGELCRISFVTLTVTTDCSKRSSVSTECIVPLVTVKRR